ncbi:MAG: TetR/AcrR family transcriptional regulator [Methanomicrobiales archaeon]|nr:TetR/AcrR family transcriptional regulator [Methanomicrobiales archaeon]
MHGEEHSRTGRGGGTKRGRKGAGTSHRPGRPHTPGVRERILAAALRLFTTQGFHHTPTAQISREAGVSTGTLFHYFPDKSALTDQLYLSIQREVADAARAGDDGALPTGERLGRFFRSYIRWGMANPGKVRFLEQFYNSPSIGDEVKHRAYNEFRWLHDVGDAAIREGVMRDLPLDFYFVMVPQVLNGILALIRSGKTTLAPDEIVAYGLALILKEEKRRDLHPSGDFSSANL